MKRLEVYVPNEYWEALKDLADKENVFISNIIVGAVAQLDELKEIVIERRR
jgi:hypothetical protein